MTKTPPDFDGQPFELDLQPSDDLGDEDEAWAYIERLVSLFEDSPEGRRLVEEGDEIAFTPNLLDFGFGYLGASPATMDPAGFREILFEIFPRKMSVAPEEAGAIIREFRAFWQFVHREFEHAPALKLLEVLDQKSESRLKKELANPANFGMAKAFFTQGQEAGFDVSTEEGLAAWVSAYNRLLDRGLDDRADSFPAFLPDLADHAVSATKPPAAKLKQARRNKRKAEKAARKRTRK